MSDYTPDKIIHQKTELTLAEMIRVAVVSESCVVTAVKRRATYASKYGVIVVMLGSAGRDTAWDTLKEITESYPSRCPANQMHKLRMNLNDPLGLMFEWLESTGESWATMNLTDEASGASVGAAIFSGNRISKKVADQMTRLGIPTYLR
jgi:predicted Zn-ribbon and HTH transcriptional regulator